MRAAVLVLLLALGVAACGNERTRPPDADTPVTPEGERPVRLKQAGLRFTAPGNWPDLPRVDPREGGIRSGRATLAVWRYTRSQELPRTREELERVRDLLLERVRTRDTTYEARNTRIVRRGGAPGIELLGTQTLAGNEVDVRSTHLFTRGSEFVIDAYAPPAQFESVDETVFLPALRSLRFTR